MQSQGERRALISEATCSSASASLHANYPFTQVWSWLGCGGRSRGGDRGRTGLGEEIGGGVELGEETWARTTGAGVVWPKGAA